MWRQKYFCQNSSPQFSYCFSPINHCLELNHTALCRRKRHCRPEKITKLNPAQRRLDERTRFCLRILPTPKGRDTPDMLSGKFQQTGEMPEVAIRADIEIPERNLKTTISFRGNRDLYLSASHTIDISFALLPDFTGGGVGYVQSVRCAGHGEVSRSIAEPSALIGYR
jgi:hypothetical protein